MLKLFSGCSTTDLHYKLLEDVNIVGQSVSVRASERQRPYLEALLHVLLPVAEVARELGFSQEEVNSIREENPDSLTAQSFTLLKKWVHRDGRHATSESGSESQRFVDSYSQRFIS